MNSPVCPACNARRTRKSSAGVGEFEGHQYTFLRCLSCGTAFVWSPPPPHLIERMYGPEYSDEHYGTGGLQQEEMGRALAMIEKVTHGGRLLDVGAGGGSFLLDARARGFTAEGFELNPKAAQKLESQLGLPVFSVELGAVPHAYAAVHG
jgi:hypothetical protein